jgi:hypothetical protein
MESKDTKIKARRLLLSELSRRAEQLRDQRTNEAQTENEAIFWATRTINYMLLHHIYDIDEATEFKTFNEWKREGATIVKGSKAFTIWGQPREASHKQKEEPKPPAGETPEDVYSFFPLCFLFSDKQVTRPEDRKKETAVDPEQVQQAAGVLVDDTAF